MSREAGASFVDEARITAIGGDGGNGCVSFRREKFVPRGGPDGGDGGNGGSVVLVADEGVGTLLAFRYRPLFRAERGRHGQGSNKAGRSGEDLVVTVPVGTLVLDDGGVAADLDAPGLRFVAARGGRGGRGNARFRSSTNQAPTHHEDGREGERREYRLELKLLADVGLVGFPNAGKSTLISRLSAAHPKIADYPFTTLIPHLGVVDRGDYRSFVMADLPGLIEGAHRGSGLGHRFLRHIERCRVLLHLVDPTAEGRDPISDIRTINRELRRYGGSLARKPQILVATKADAAQDPEVVRRIERYAETSGTPFLGISSVRGDGLQELVQATGRLLDRTRGPTARTRARSRSGGAQRDAGGPRQWVGVVGGSFDPVHLAHLRVARSVSEVFGLRRTLLIPCAVPPHKPDARLASAEHRLRMLRLAVADLPGIEVDDREIERGGTSFTIDTLRELRAEGSVAPLFVMGMDSLLEIHTWHEHAALLDEFDVVVVDRPGHADPLGALPGRVGTALVEVPASPGAGAALLAERAGVGGAIYHLRLDPLPVSASRIRDLARRGEPLDGLVPPAVAEYIRNAGLYRQEGNR